MRGIILKKVQKRLLFLVLFLFSALFASAQAMQVYDYFEDVSNHYAQFTTYKARIVIKMRNQKDMEGTIYVKDGDIRLDFNDGAILCVADGNLTLYDPQERVVLQQEMVAENNLASSKGLSMLKKYYKYSYYSSEGYKLVPLEAKSQEEVIKLKFDAKWGSLEFRNLVISFTSNNLIRRIEGNTFSGSRVVIDYMNIQTNISIPENIFKYDPPGNAHTVKNFIYTPE